MATILMVLKKNGVEIVHDNWYCNNYLELDKLNCWLKINTIYKEIYTHAAQFIPWLENADDIGVSGSIA